MINKVFSVRNRQNDTKGIDCKHKVKKNFEGRETTLLNRLILTTGSKDKPGGCIISRKFFKRLTKL